MPVPVIDPTRSILGFLEDQAFEFQPYATETPTSWTAAGLPPGVDFDTDTGLFSGAATLSGVWLVTLNAVNGTGTSADAIVTIGVQPAPKNAFGHPTLLVELNTGAIYVPGADGGWLAVIDEEDKTYPALWLKSRDVTPILVQFADGEAYADPSLTSLKLTLKRFEPERIVGEFGGTVAADKMIRIDGARPELIHFAIVAELTAAALHSELSDAEGDDGTFFYALAEIEWQVANTLGIGPATLTRTSNTFVVGVERDLNRAP